ncbi:phosphoribosyl 1,2-cyclic phosphate phosphodiesterase [Flavobacteriaceae bacterium UJ101]|nr:phosphoribosyl 1,2-cyclic phosphate phosphodiesterase [Flavobacteriaceae bacterium UJ101]
MSNSGLEITFLGTASSLGSPVIGFDHPVCHSKNPKDKRLRSSILLKKYDKTFVIDCSPDFREQMLRSQCTSLNAILFTHEHADHTAGLDDIRPFNFLMKKDIPLYGEKRTLESIQKRFDYCFMEPKYPGAPGLEVHLINNRPFEVENISIQPIRIMHGDLPILGFRIDDFAYITDAGFIDPIELEKLKHLDVLVINALRKRIPHHSQFTLEQALEVIQKVNPKKTYITHISPVLGFHDEVEQELPKNVFLAYDGLMIKA